MVLLHVFQNNLMIKFSVILFQRLSLATVTVTTMVFSRRLAGCGVMLDHFEVFNNVINNRRNSLLCAGCSHFEGKTQSKDAEQRGEVSHMRRFCDFQGITFD